MRLDKRLKEMNFGYLEGEKNSELKKGKPEGFEAMCEVGWVEEGGENMAMVIDRIASFFEELVRTYDNETILIASHGMWINFALSYLLKLEKFTPIENCSVSKIIYDGNDFYAEFINNIQFREE